MRAEQKNENRKAQKSFMDFFQCFNIIESLINRN